MLSNINLHPYNEVERDLWAKHFKQAEQVTWWGGASLTLA